MLKKLKCEVCESLVFGNYTSDDCSDCLHRGKACEGFAMGCEMRVCASCGDVYVSPVVNNPNESEIPDEVGTAFVDPLAASNIPIAALCVEITNDAQL